MNIEKIFSELFIDFSQKFECEPKSIKALLFKREDTGEIDINLYLNNSFKTKIDIQRDILKLKMDFMGKTFMVKQVLNIFLGAYKEELQCEEKDIFVHIEPRSNEDTRPIIALKKGNDFVRWISLDEFNL